MGQKPNVLPDSFLDKFEKNASGCWIWRLSKFPDGYGKFSYQGKLYRAHRIAAHLAFGMPLDSTQFVLHSCHERACVNPEHLSLGNHQENMDQMYAASRGPTGERAGKAKLTWREVREIRRRYAAGGVRQVDLAEEFGVVQTIISRIVRRETWRDDPCK